MLLDTEFSSKFKNKRHAINARTFYNHRLISSLKYLIGEFAKVYSYDCDSLRQILENIDLKKKLSPWLFYLNSQLLICVKQNDLVRAKSMLTGKFVSPYSNERVDLRNFGKKDWDESIKIDIENIKEKDKQGRSAYIKPASNENFINAKESLDKAIALIKANHKVAASYIDTFVSEIVIFDGAVVMGMTDVKVYGSVYIRLPNKVFDPVVYFCEHLIHEMSHLFLHAFFAEDQILLNGQAERYDAPIREDKRPLYGIFHATFVLSRMIRVFEKIINNNPNKDHFEISLQTFYLQFALGFYTIQKHAKLTPKGLLIHNSMQDIANKVKVGQKIS